MVETWRKEHEETLVDCRIFLVRRKRMRSQARPDLEHEFYALHSPDWVNVAALREDGQLLLIRQWRAGTEDIQRAYVQARVVVEELARRHGIPSWHAFCRRLSEGASIEKAYDEVFSPSQWSRLDQGIFD